MLQNETNQTDLTQYITINHLNSKYTTNVETRNQNTSTPMSPKRSFCSKSVLEYKPKRKIKIAPLSKIPLSSIGKGVFNFNTFVTSSKEENSKINSDLEFRTTYIIKYAQNAENFYKTKRFVDYISENKKGNFTELYEKIKKLLESQNRILFDQISNLNKPVISLCCEYNSLMNKYCESIFTELQSEKEQNMKLRKRNFELETNFQSKTNELNQLNSYVNRYDVSNKIHIKKGKEETIEQIKHTFLQKENSYLLTIYRLEDEIRDLTLLLEKNKDYYEKFKDTEEKVEEKRKQNEEMRFVFNKELHDKAIENAIMKDKEYELNEKIAELNKEITQLKEENDNKQREFVDISTQIKKLQMNLAQNNERFYMMNEEMEQYMIGLEREKMDHYNTAQALSALENRFYKENEEKENELKKQEQEKNQDKDKEKDKEKEGESKKDSEEKEKEKENEKSGNKEENSNQNTEKKDNNQAEEQTNK